jgi:uncharacterized membrane protein
MNFPAGLFGTGWQLAGWLAAGAVLAWAAGRAPWRRLQAPGRVHVFGGLVVALLLLWSLKAGIKPGLDLHLVGATVFVLAFGPQLALLGLALVLAGATANGVGAWESFGLNLTVMAAVPVLVAQAVFRTADRGLPNHLFVYLFVAGFLGAGLAVLGMGAVAGGLLYAAGAYGGEYLLTEYLPYFMLLAFSEAWISGMAMTLMVVYRPAWVCTFDDARYLLNK